MTDLTQMPLEELWQLFPISLVAPRPEWQTNYIEMETRLMRLLVDYPVVRISHIGSTAVPGIWAKDIVDILVEVTQGADLSVIATVLERDGLLVMSSADGRISLNLGYTPEGFADKVYHVHLRYVGDNDELYYRDYLREHPDVAQAYETLKLSLWHSYEHDRDGYTAAKGAFIYNWTARAHAEYPGRYNIYTEEE